jgi:SagB-type dehydrogenase family enzyme
MSNAETERMFAYHEATKHTPESLRRSRHVLEWENMPDPFRHYEGVPVIDLPADPPPPAVRMLDVLHGAKGPCQNLEPWQLLSQILFYSASISATKRVPSMNYSYALRVNPSSGNLHPTEIHFGTREGLYHYRVSSHMAEQRASGDYAAAVGSAPLVFVLTTIAWREAWKYRSRAYRYCLLDAGHASESLLLAIRSAGYEARATGHFADGALAELLGVRDEWPMIRIDAGLPEPPANLTERTRAAGAPNRLSAEEVDYPLIDAIQHSSTLDEPVGPFLRNEPEPSGPGEIPLGESVESKADYGAVVRRRRSALDFQGGPEFITFRQLSTLFNVSRPLLNVVSLYAYVHRVAGLAPGAYRFHPASRTLETIKKGDQQVMAAALSLGQELAGNACVAFSMIADLERCARLWGNRGYRYAHFEAGTIGQRLYLASEAMGFRSTGIGAFYDDHVHRYLDIPPERGQVVYHFACGYPVPDQRIEG